MDDLHTANGRQHSLPSVPDGVAFHLGKAIGGIEHRLDTMDRHIVKLDGDLQEIRKASLLGLKPLDWIRIGAGITVLIWAATGDPTWVRNLPLVGRIFGASG